MYDIKTSQKGLEPLTIPLTGERSTIELLAIKIPYNHFFNLGG